MKSVEISTPHSRHHVPEEKLTSFGLHVTAREAYEMWKAGRERIQVLDVRTFEEYVLIGHADSRIRGGRATQRGNQENHWVERS